MGIVYRALDTRLGRPVAIKMLPAEATSDAERHRRFVQEARSASALNHPAIVTIHDIDEHDGTTFIAMELVDGTPLDRLLAGGPLPVEEALDYARQIAAGLAAAHAAGIVHRDLKPANVMITRDRRAKILDFGLAKLIAARSEDATLTAMGTRTGVVMGTASYMSPEQAQARPVSARSDVFSFGAVLYEMLAGRRAFAADSEIGLLTAILRDQPPPLETIRPAVSADVQALVHRCLAKDPSARYADGGELHTALAAISAPQVRTAPVKNWRRPAVLVPAALVLIAAAAGAAWQVVETRRGRWARQEALPQIEQLNLSGRSMQSVRLARAAEPYAPHDVQRVREAWVPFSMTTEPAGAQVEMKNYFDPEGPWEPVGPSPIQDYRVPFGYYRVRVSKPGYVTLEVSAIPTGRSPIKLTPEGDASPGMVFVPGRAYRAGIAAAVTLPDYWIGKLEVTNAEFKRFVDAGGYSDPTRWKAPFEDDGRHLTFDEAMGRFRDSTGRPGPATWEVGSYPEGQADYPVGGISWFEATAYAEFAGKSLPSVAHWMNAAGVDEIYSDILQLSNFDGKGPARAGERGGVGPWGTLDMAGNLKEWAVNPVTGSTRRYILGGGWNEPSYTFVQADAQDPWKRDATYGVRLVENLGPAEHTVAAIGRVMPDPETVVPVSAELLEVYKRFYAYDPTPLDIRVEQVDDSNPHWVKQKVSFRAAYRNERVPAFLYLPRNATPPYQTIVLFPSAYAANVSSSGSLDLGTFQFLVRSGRALLYPVYQGTYERRGNRQPGPSGTRDLQIEWAKDFFRAVDYLATREDIDMDRLGYYSLSMGAFFGPIPVALEPRIKAAVFASGGLRYFPPPETQPANFAPQVKVPVLLVNGKDDFAVPLNAQKRFFEIIGSRTKKHIALEGGHVPQDIRGLFREVLDWFDTHLGQVK